jgi:hypothetical protein
MRTDFASRVILDSPCFFFATGGPAPPCLGQVVGAAMDKLPSRPQRVPEGTLSCLRNYSSAPELTCPGGQQF